MRWKTNFRCSLNAEERGKDIRAISNKMTSISKRKELSFSRFCHVRLFATPRTVAHQAPLSVGFSRQEYWSGLSFPSPGDLPDPGIESRSPTLQADALPSKPPGKTIISYAAAAKSLRSCPTLCDPVDGSPPGSPIPGILQARTLEWGAISFSNA